MRTDLSKDPTNGGGPVDHHRPEGREITRRTLIKTGAAAGAATVGLSASTGSASAQSATSTAATAAKMGLMASPTGFVAFGVYSAIAGTRSPNEDLIARNNLHQSAVAEQQSWDGHFVQFENRLEDSAMVAHIESRDAIARSYENGESSGNALTAMNQRVSNWYGDAPEHNVIEIANKVLLSLHAVAQDGANTDPVFYVMASGTDSNDNGYNIVLSPESDGTTANQTVALHNGDEHEIGNGVVEADDNEIEDPVTPLIEIWEDTGSGGYPDGEKVGETPLLSDSIIDSYDEDRGANAAFQTELDDGTVIESDLIFGIPGISDNDDVNPEDVFYFSDVVDLLDEISDQSDTVVNQYDQSFVQDLYDAMDSGELDPNDIRGSAGMAQFLSGTDDASESRFQLALMQQLGLSRSDLSTVASMTIEYSGATGRNVVRENGTRSIHPDNFVEGKVLEGQLFARSDATSIESGAEYAADPVIYVYGDDPILKALTPGGSLLWSSDVVDQYGRDMSPSPIGDAIYVSNDGSKLLSIDPADGSERWRRDGVGGQLAVASDGSTVFTSDGSNLLALNAEDGSTTWSSSDLGDTVESVSISPDGETVFAGIANGDVVAINSSDGSSEWTAGLGSTAVTALASGPDGAVYAGAADIQKLDQAGGSSQWTYPSAASEPSDMAVSSDGSMVFAGDLNGEVHAIDTTDGSASWTDAGADSILSVAVTPDGSVQVITFDGEDANLRSLDGDYGSENWTYTDWPQNARMVTATPRTGQAVVENATFLDAGEGEEYNLTNGQIKITEITDADGNEMDESDYSEPEYDTFDSGEYSKYIEEHTTYQETIYKETGPGWNPPCLIGCGDDGGDWIGLVIIGAILFMVVGWVTDLLPFVGGD